MSPVAFFAVAKSSPLKGPCAFPVTVIVIRTPTAALAGVAAGRAPRISQPSAAKSNAASEAMSRKLRLTTTDRDISVPLLSAGHRPAAHIVARPNASSVALPGRFLGYCVGGPEVPAVGGPEVPAVGGPPAPWVKPTTGTARSPSSAWKNANGLNPSMPAIKDVGRVCSLML